MSTTMLPTGANMSMPAPAAAASGSGIIVASRAPQALTASVSARCSSSVAHSGRHIVSLAPAAPRLRPNAFMKKSPSISPTADMSAITPSFMGYIMFTPPGVRP